MPRRRLFVEARLTVRNLKSESDQIDGFFYKMPASVLSFWNLFEILGSKEQVDFERCAAILKTYYDDNGDENSDQCLSDTVYNNTLTIYKLLLADGIISKASSTTTPLYAPNSLRQMRPFGSLFYPDKPYLERRLVCDWQPVREICLFDVKDLIRVIVERSESTTTTTASGGGGGGESGRRTNERSMFEVMCRRTLVSWKQMLELLVSSGGFSGARPRPLSDILIEKIRDHSIDALPNDLINES